MDNVDYSLGPDADARLSRYGAAAQKQIHGLIVVAVVGICELPEFCADESERVFDHEVFGWRFSIQFTGRNKFTILDFNSPEDDHPDPGPNPGTNIRELLSYNIPALAVIQNPGLLKLKSVLFRTNFGCTTFA